MSTDKTVDEAVEMLQQFGLKDWVSADGCVAIAGRSAAATTVTTRALFGSDTEQFAHALRKRVTTSGRPIMRRFHLLVGAESLRLDIPSPGSLGS